MRHECAVLLVYTTLHLVELLDVPEWVSGVRGKSMTNRVWRLPPLLGGSRAAGKGRVRIAGASGLTKHFIDH